MTCLERVSDRLSNLTESDKEVFYSEVKNLIKIISWNQERFQKEKEAKKQIAMVNKKFGLNLDVEMVSDDSDSELAGEESKHSSKRRD